MIYNYDKDKKLINIITKEYEKACN